MMILMKEPGQLERLNTLAEEVYPGIRFATLTITVQAKLFELDIAFLRPIKHDPGATYVHGLIYSAC